MPGLLDAYRQNIGDPFAQLVGGAGRGFLGLGVPAYAGSMGMDAYRTGQALSNMPGLGAPAGLLKAAANAPDVAAMLGGLLSKGVGKLAKTKAPQDDALELARQNAVKMLGLPENNTAMDRARAMGFDIDLFHGRKGDYPNFDISFSGRSTNTKGVSRNAVDTTNDPSVAGDYALNSNIPESFEIKRLFKIQEKTKNQMVSGKTSEIRNQAGLEFMELNNKIRELSKTPGILGFGMDTDLAKYRANVMPLLARSKDVLQTDPAIWNQKTRKDGLKAASDQGYAGVSFKDVNDVLPHFKDPKTYTHTTTAFIKPERLRSRFAAFDPARVNENDLLGRADPRLLALIAAGTGGGLLGYNYLNSGQPK
jgi:hypothetical protein